MKTKFVHTLLAILIATCLMLLGIELIFKIPYQPFYKTTFDLQKEYTKELENKLINLLEPAVGIGNVRASVHAEITYQNITETTVNPYTFAQTKIHEKGPILTEQSVSILINDKNKEKLPIYQRLVKSAVGFNAGRGDLLSIEMLPFVKVPLWTLGLSPIFLVRIAAILILLIIIASFWLVKQLLSSSNNLIVPRTINESIWQQIEDIPSYQLALLLKIKRPETTATILYCLSHEKMSEIVALLPSDYMKKVVLHLSHIEKLTFKDKNFLFYKTEQDLQEIIQAFDYLKKTQQSGSTAFELLKNWSDSDLRNLLRYISKKDLIKALQQSSLAIQQSFSRNIPSALWYDFVQQMENNPCSKNESLEAQEKIVDIAQHLKET